MKQQITQKSTVSAKWIYDNKETDIPESSISYVIFDYDYDNNNMPIGLIILNLKTSLYNEMVNKVNESVIFLEVMSYNYAESNPSKKVVIKEQFNYYLPNDNDTHEDLALGAADMTGDEQAYTRVTIGLMKQRVLDDNRKFFKDCIYRDINRNTLMYLGLKHVERLCICIPETPNENMDYVGFPPITSVNEYLRHVDYTAGLYELGYRYFHDYRITYLLDVNGTYVSDGSGQYKTVMIEVDNNTNPDSAMDGYFADSEKNMYSINIAAINSPISVDKVTPTVATDIVNIGLEGTTGTAELSDVKKEKAIYERSERPYISSARLNFEAKKYKNTISVSKSQMDGSMITPNKVYTVKNYDKYSAYNGRYVLYRKQVVFAYSAGEFIPTTLISLRKQV